MEKMSKIAKTLSVIANIIAIMCIVGGCIMVVCAVPLMFVDDNVLAEVTSTLILGPATFELAPELVPEVSIVRTQIIIGLLAISVLAFFMAYAFKMGRKVLGPMTEQNPFDESVSKNLRKLGITTLVFGIVMPIVGMITEAVTLYAYKANEIFLSDKIVGVEFDFEFDLTFIIISCILFMLSYIFKYGTELQAQSDETL